MNDIASNWMARIFDPAWLMGPIFDKELRVSSRRRRNYVLRFAYVSLFTFFLALMWVDVVAYSASSVYMSSRMAMAGLSVITFIVWFQFLTAQVIAIVMLSTSISDEIYNRTLGVLMTTPIGSTQIVLGKLFSKLLQVVLLLAISLPLLAIVRVFGGVPWGHLVCSLCVTLTTVIFIGSLSLFFSIFTRRAYVVIIVTILTLAFLFALLPLLVAFLAYYPTQPSPKFVDMLSYVNPYFIMTIESGALFAAAPPGVGNWPIHCVVMLGASALLLLLATIVVRKVALRQATGQTGLWRARGKGKAQGDSDAGGSVRRVVGPPVLWKERRMPVLGRRKIVAVIGILLLVGTLFLTYQLCAMLGALESRDTQTGYVIIFTGIGMLFTVIVPATCITSERESRAWPLLLTTTVSDWEILGSKFLGAVYRCLPAWALLFGHVTVFAIAGMIHPVALLQLGILVAWIVIFLSGTGLYFSTRFRHTTTAVIANMALAAGLWAIFPLLLGLILAVAKAGDGLLELYVDTNPFVHAGVIAAATSNQGRLAAYSWMQGGITDLAGATGWIVLTFIIYVALAVVFLLIARLRLRLNPF